MSADDIDLPTNGPDSGRGRPVDRPEGTGSDAGSAIRFRWWNLLLALPLLMLLTPVFNKVEPRLFGLPLFYWFQFVFVFVGVATVAIVFTATRTPKNRPDDRERNR